MGYTPPTLNVNKISGGWSLAPPDNTTTDDLTIFPNTVDTSTSDTYIVIEGKGSITLKHATTGVIRFYRSTVQYMNTDYDGTDVKIISIPADKNLLLSTAGTGLVKFGAYTAGAATDSTGYITILDAAGNTRKLMVQA